MKPKIYFAADHWGFELVPVLVEFVNKLGYEAEHCGPFEFDENDDYPDFVSLAAKYVSENPEQSLAIVFGRSGQGEAMCANRYAGVRAAVYYGGPTDILTLSREHNNSNVLSIGAGFLNLDEIKAAISLWLDTPFSNEDRHVRRIKKLDI